MPRCSPLHQTARVLPTDEADRLISELQLHEQVQIPASVAQQGLVGFLQKVRSAGRHVLSPSFFLETTPEGTQLVNALDTMGDQVNAFHSLVGRRWVQAGLRGLREGSRESFLVAQIVENPQLRNNAQFMQTMPDIVKRAVRFWEDIRDEWAIALGLPPGRRLSDYFPHFFDRKTIRAEAQILRERLASGQLEKEAPELAARAPALLADLDKVIAAIDKGEDLATLGLPNKLGMRFMETRHGAQGYTLDFVKAFNAYENAVSRKLVQDPWLPVVRERLVAIPDEADRILAAQVVRDSFGRVLPTTDNLIAPLMYTIRAAEFHRTIGFMNLGVALKNLGQSLFTLVEGGPKAARQGMHMAMSALTDKQGYLRDLVEGSGALQSLPPWVYRGTARPGESQWATLARVSGFFFNTAERANRQLAFFTGIAKWFDTPAAKGLDLGRAIELQSIPQEAIDYARQFIRKTQFKYGATDTPILLRDPVAGTAFQYQSYYIKSVELMWKWLVRDGKEGKAKFAAMMGMGLGLTSLFKLAGLDLSQFMGVPLDFLSAVNLIKGLNEKDIPRVKAAAAQLVTESLFDSKLGPTAGLLGGIGRVVTAVGEGQDASRILQTLAARDLTPTQARRVYRAYTSYVADPTRNATHFIEALAGVPNMANTVRLSYLQALEDGHIQKARDLLVAYRKARGGNLPVDMAEAAAALRRGRQTRLTQALQKAKETPAEALRRRLPVHLERILQP